MSHPYQYVVLRYVPRVDRGECLNVGVVVHSQSAGVLRCAYHLDEARVRALAPDADLDALRAALDAVCAMCDHPPSETDATLMLKKLPGIFVAGEMIDWEAPTGGYLMQGCFATATRAAKSAVEWIG